MGDQFDFSLLIGSQYDGGPMEWDEQTLYVSTGTILNHVDINKVSKQDVMTARWYIFEAPPKKNFTESSTNRHSKSDVL